MQALKGCTAMAAAVLSLGAVAVATASTNAKSVTIGFDQRTSNAPYYVAMIKEAQILAKQKGFKLILQNAGGDPVTQINQVQTMTTEGVDVLIVNAADPGTEKIRMTAIAKKIPMLFIDTPIPGVGFTTVQSDNLTIGRLSGKLMAQRIGKGKTIKLAILNGGPADTAVGPARRAGFLAGLKAGGVNYTLVGEANAGYSQDKAVTQTQDLLVAHPDIDVIFGYNDAMALGALSVLKTKKNTHVLLSGVDGQKQAMAAIKAGGCSGQYVSTGLNSPLLAAKNSVQIALAVATGSKKTSDYPDHQFTEAAGIGCQNVAKFYSPKSIF